MNMTDSGPVKFITFIISSIASLPKSVWPCCDASVSW